MFQLYGKIKNNVRNSISFNPQIVFNFPFFVSIIILTQLAQQVTGYELENRESITGRDGGLFRSPLHSV
jgi:hypothetical protein